MGKSRNFISNNGSLKIDPSEGVVQVCNKGAKSNILLVCEHASNYFPTKYQNLGLDEDAIQSHAAWDPGAFSVAKHLSDNLDAALVFSGVSRLVYDCNRPPESPGAMTARSEVIDVPGNMNLSPSQRAARAIEIYFPFRDCLASTIDAAENPVILVTIHSFTPVYLGKSREVEIGILHDTDHRLADTMLNNASRHTDLKVLRNEPYGAEDGVTHTLKIHGIQNGILNVMLEIRNDLIQSQTQQKGMAIMLTNLLSDAIADLDNATLSGATA